MRNTAAITLNRQRQTLYGRSKLRLTNVNYQDPNRPDDDYHFGAAPARNCLIGMRCTATREVRLQPLLFDCYVILPILSDFCRYQSQAIPQGSKPVAARNPSR
jgi:hypothetical protein